MRRLGLSQTPSVCVLSQVVVVVALVALGWAAFSEMFVSQTVTVGEASASGKSQQDGPSHLYMPPIVVVEDLDCNFLKTVRLSTEAAMHKIESNWRVSDFPNFLKMMHVPRTSWSLQKAKFINLILEQAQASRDNTKNDYYGRPYVAGFSGSSVTAGHDNFFNEAFPAVFERSLQPVFESLRMKLDVRNNAIGNNPCFPYDACISTHLGDDLDFLAWEQSMNCGRDSRPLDTFTRSALRMKKSPTVLYVLSGGPAWRPDECQNVTKAMEDDVVRKSRLPSSVIDVKTIQAWASQDTAPSASSTSASSSTTSNLLTSMEFLKDGNEHLFDPTRFGAVAPMGHSTFPCQEYKCIGPYNANFTVKTPGGNGANWHPGALGHQLRGENMAYFLLAMLLDAVQTMEDLAKTVPDTCVSSRTAATGTEPVVVEAKPPKATAVAPTTVSIAVAATATTVEASKPPSPSTTITTDEPTIKLHTSEAANASLPINLTPSHGNHSTAEMLSGRMRGGVHGNRTVNHHGPRDGPRSNGPHRRHRKLSSSSSSTSSSPRSATGGELQIVFPKQLSIPQVAKRLNLKSLPTAPVMDESKLSVRIVRYVHHHHMNDAHDSTTSANNSPSPSSVITVSVWTMLSAWIQEYLYHQLHHGRVVPPVPSHYHIDETTYPPNCFTDYEPRANRGHSISAMTVNMSTLAPAWTQKLMHSQPANSSVFWQSLLSPFDANAVNKAQQRGLGYLDRKYAYFSQGLHSVLSLKVHSYHAAPVWLCELQKGFLKYPASMTDLDAGADVTVYLNYFTRKGHGGSGSSSSSTTDATTETRAADQQSSKGLRGSGGGTAGHHLSSMVSTVALSEATGTGNLMPVGSGATNPLDDEAHTLRLKLELLSDQCYRTTSLVPPGEHLLVVEQKGSQQVNLAYVVVF